MLGVAFLALPLLVALGLGLYAYLTTPAEDARFGRPAQQIQVVNALTAGVSS